MKMDTLKKEIEKQIIDKILNSKNCSQFYLESIKVISKNDIIFEISLIVLL